MRSGSVRLTFLISSVLFMVLFLVFSGWANAQQESAEKSPEITSTSVEKLLQQLEDPQQLEKLKQDLRTLLAAQEAAKKGEPEESKTKESGLVGQLLSVMSSQIQDINQVLSDVGGDLLAIPSLVKDLAVKAREPGVLKAWIEMFIKIALVILAGFLAQLVVKRLLAKARKSLQDKDTYNKGLRAMFLIGSTILELIPVGAFAAAAYGLLPLLEPSTPTQLVALTLINAIVLVRIILVLVKLLLVPEATALRILPLDNESVHYLYIWVRRVAALGVYGYFILEAALLLGLPQSLYTFLLKILGLVITAMAAVLILQNRKEVANWLRGDQQPLADNELKADSKTQSNMDQKKQTIKALRGRLADFWHIAAIVLIGGMFGTWALEIEGGFQFLARAIVLTVMVVALASFLVRLSMRGMQQLFKISEDLKQKFPDLEARANRYLPILNNIIKGAIYIVAVFSILQAWGLGALSWLFSAQGQGIVSSLFVMALIICGAFLLWEIVSSRIKFSLEREKMLEGKKDNTRKLTLLPLISNVIRISLILVAGMSVLAHLGINIAPLLAGAGVIGLAIGFGAQTLVKDVITGAFILMENSIAVGDWVEAGGHAGTVEHLTVRTLTLRDLNGTVHVVPFGDVTSVLNYNRDYGYAVIDAGVAYRENYGEVVQALQDVASELQQDEKWGGDIIGDLEVFGLNNLGDSAVEVRVRLKTRPLCQFAVRRAFLERMKRTFDERDIEIPFPHQTVWFGIDKEGQAPAMRVIHEKDKTLPVSKEAEKETAQPQAGPEINYYTETDAAKDVVEEKKQGEEDEKQQSS